MSDFVFSRINIEKGRLTEVIQSIYNEDPPSVKEFHGKWGSLAVTRNIYNGFQHYETDKHICIVIGGPLLSYRDNTFINNNGSTVEGTKSIYHRMINDLVQWDDDLSGPFVILLVNKENLEVECITDLMSFIPVYKFCNSENIILSTHVDILARVAKQEKIIDLVSQADFIIHGTVTYPYTCYSNIMQIAPASKHLIKSDQYQLFSESYWIPEEKNKYNSINEAAKDLRNSLQSYVNTVMSNATKIAHFISGGEDSRTLAGLIPKGCKRDAFIFLDNMNREGKIAKKAAEAYGSSFNIATRSKTHYLEILPTCANLVGQGSQYMHAHTFGFHKSCRLNEYSSVFGGLFSDALLKGARIKKKKIFRGVPFLPQIKRSDYSVTETLNNNLFKSNILKELTHRRQSHLNYIKSFRKESAEEWFELWPSSMNVNIPNIHVNRRLFKSYEPFMSNDIVKISASVPQKWKLNRRLFQRAVKPFLKPTKWLLHGDGRLPYFPWYINSFIQFFIWSSQQVAKRIGLVKGNQGPWGEWSFILKSNEWQLAIKNYSAGIKPLNTILEIKDPALLFKDNRLSDRQKVNLLQVMFFNQKI